MNSAIQRSMPGLRMSPLLLLLACEAIGDLSEQVGAIVDSPLRDAGGGPPNLKDDGGYAVSWYLDQVAAENYQACELLREEVRQGDFDREALDERSQQIEEAFQPWLDDMGLSIDVHVGEDVGARLGGTRLALNRCRFEGCSLGCEGEFTVASLEGDDGEAERWSSPSELMRPSDGPEDRFLQLEAVCLRHQKGGESSTALDGNYFDWKQTIDELQGAEDSEPFRTVSPDITLKGEDDGSVAWGAIEAGDAILLKMGQLDRCLKKDGGAVRYQVLSVPSVDSGRLTCDGDTGALGFDVSVSGSRGTGNIGPEPRMEMLVTAFGSEVADDGLPQRDFVYHRGFKPTCGLPSSKDIVGIGEVKDYVKARLEAEAWVMINTDEQQIRSAYDKLSQSDPSIGMECSIEIPAAELGDFSCESDKEVAYELVIRDKDGRWSRPTTVF